MYPQHMAMANAAQFQQQGGPPFGVPPSQSPMPVGGVMQHGLGPSGAMHLGVPPNMNMNMNVPCMMQPPGAPFFMHHGLPPGAHPFADRDRIAPPGRLASMLQPEYKLFELNRRLQQRPQEPECDNIWWDGFCNDFFEDDATLAISLVTDEGAPELYRVGRTLIGRFFRTMFEAGIADMYWYVRQPKEPLIRQAPGQRPLLIFDSEQTSLMTQYHSPICKVVTDGRLLLEFTFDDLMRIRTWSFAIRQYSELVPRHVLMQDDASYLEHTARNVTRCGLPLKVITFFKMCVILEPMQELMGRQKVYKINPRECLKKALYDKWLHTCAPPDTGKPTTSKKKKRRNANETAQSASGSLAGSSVPLGPGLGGLMPNSGKGPLDAVKLEAPEQKDAPPSKKRTGGRGRKNNAGNSASATAAQPPASQPQPPQASTPAARGVPNAEVMIVGEPQLLGGDVGLEDERVITRVENSDYMHGQAAANGPVPIMPASNPAMSANALLSSNPPGGPPPPSLPPAPLQSATGGPSGPGTPLMAFGSAAHLPNGLPPGPYGMPFPAQAPNGQLTQPGMRGSPLTVPSPASSLGGQKNPNANGGRSGSASVATPLAVGGPLSNQRPSRPGSVGSAASVHSVHSNAPFNNLAPQAPFDFEHQHAAGGSTSSLDGSVGHASGGKRRGSFDT